MGNRGERWGSLDGKPPTPFSKESDDVGDLGVKKLNGSDQKVDHELLNIDFFQSNLPTPDFQSLVIGGDGEVRKHFAVRFFYVFFFSLVA